MLFRSLGGVNVSDSVAAQFGGTTFAVAVSETVQASSTVSGVPTYSRAIAESSNASDSVQAGAVLGSQITESSAVYDFAYTQHAITGQIFEAVQGSDSVTYTGILGASV